MKFEIRPYHPVDLSALHRICLLTADNGEDGSHLYPDPDLIGHIFAAPYAVFEPDLCFVLTGDGTPCGYVLGTRDTAAFQQRCEQDWLPPLRARYPMPEADDDSRNAKMIHSIHTVHKPDDDLIDYPAHLHIDILPVGQGQGWGAKLIETFLNRLRALNVPAVHLGVSKMNPRAVRFYEHIGFHKVKEYDTGIMYGMKLQTDN